MYGQCDVLIVDQSEETREVLQTVLERHGVRTLAVGKVEKGLELARKHHPELVVLDLETEDVPAMPFGECFSRGTDSKSTHESTEINSSKSSYQPQMILLGSMRGLPDGPREREIVRKPYHYGLLIRKIEELLEQKR